MYRNTFSFLILMIAVHLAASVPLIAQEKTHHVRVIGEMRKVMWEGKLEGVIALDTIPAKEHVYGLGPVEFLTASTKISQLEANGYSLQGYFYLPPKSWLEGYYDPMEGRFQAFLDRNNHLDLAQKVVRDSENEIALYKSIKTIIAMDFT